MESVTAAIIGAMRSPASVGVTPATAWRNSGTNTTMENSAAVPRKSDALATATTGVASNPIGTIGSGTRRSRMTSATPSTSAPASSPTIGAEPQS